MYLTWVNDPTAWVALLTLIVLEVVLGIDNLIFISILTNKLPEDAAIPARRLGIGAALDHAARAAGDDLHHRQAYRAAVHRCSGMAFPGAT